MAHCSETPHHFELLKAEHDLSRFFCENDYLTAFLKNRAMIEQTLNHARTYVCIDESVESERAVIGYFTLRASGFYITGRDYFIPVVDIPALARHQDRHGEDWGNVLLSEALYIVSETARLIGVTGVQLNPTEKGLKLYWEFGFTDHPIKPGYLYLPTVGIPLL